MQTSNMALSAAARRRYVLLVCIAHPVAVLGPVEHRRRRVGGEEVDDAAVDVIGTSQWDFEDNRNTVNSSGEYQSAGSADGGSSGNRAPGTDAHSRFWNVLTSCSTIGNRDSTTIPNWPGKSPNPKASSAPIDGAVVVRSNPDGTPVFNGAVKVYG